MLDAQVRLRVSVSSRPRHERELTEVLVPSTQSLLCFLLLSGHPSLPSESDQSCTLPLSVARNRPSRHHFAPSSIPTSNDQSERPYKPHSRRRNATHEGTSRGVGSSTRVRTACDHENLGKVGIVRPEFGSARRRRHDPRDFGRCSIDSRLDNLRSKHRSSYEDTRQICQQDSMGARRETCRRSWSNVRPCSRSSLTLSQRSAA